MVDQVRRKETLAPRLKIRFPGWFDNEDLIKGCGRTLIGRVHESYGAGDEVSPLHVAKQNLRGGRARVAWGKPRVWAGSSSITMRRRISKRCYRWNPFTSIDGWWCL
ncbi:unnamed protein product [Thlaspi arvense]|uniref:Uncharacterized protein n=1 Tax=Thlaspi arvense TaxID=13288 RepID=A0AAU9T346_THLAR|nr:unnamed protein product [Thlaspi arvense]